MFYSFIIFIFCVLAIFNLWQESFFMNALSEVKPVWSRYKRTVLVMVLLFFVIVTFVDFPVSSTFANHIDYSLMYWGAKIALSADSLYVVPAVVMLIALSQDSMLKFLQYKYSRMLKWNIEKLIIVLKISLTSLLLSGIANGILKAFFNRQRPVVGLDNWHIFSFFYNPICSVKGLSYACNSLPSGHTIVAISFIMPIIWSYKDNVLLKYSLLAWYILIIICRVYTLNHWTSDVFFASCLGYIVASAVYNGNKHKLGIIANVG